MKVICLLFVFDLAHKLIRTEPLESISLHFGNSAVEVFDRGGREVQK